MEDSKDLIREEALQQLDHIADGGKKGDHLREVTKMMDTISRQAAIDEIRDCYAIHGSEGSWIDQKEAFKRISSLPPAQPEHATCYLDSPCEYQNSKITLPSTQPEQPESEDITFWKKRAREYEEMVLKLIDKMARGTKIDSVLITEEGIVFKKEKPEQRWIPCSERLPDKKQDAIVTVNDGAIYTDTDEWAGEWFCAHGYDVIAWMPLPKPYKDDPCNGCGYLGNSCGGEGCGKLTERKEGEADD